MIGQQLSLSKTKLMVGLLTKSNDDKFITYAYCFIINLDENSQGPVITIGVGFEVLKKYDLPYNEEYDVKLDYVITESNVYCFNSEYT